MKEPSQCRSEVFRRFINRKHNLTLKDYHDLHKYSVSDYTFWQDLWEFENVISSKRPSKILTDGRLKECPVWFPDALWNYAENMLRYDGDAVACTSAKENGQVEHYTFRQLKVMVQRLSSAMRANGLQKGDRVAAFITNSVDAITIALAAISIGALYSSTATDMGSQGVLDRYRQTRPRLLFAESEVMYAGKTINLMPKVAEIVSGLEDHGLQTAIILPSTKTRRDANIPASLLKCRTMTQFLGDADDSILTFEQVPFSHPAFILYTSGTTGVPKCIIHSGGGVYMNDLRTIMIEHDMTADSTFFQFTTTGWMMWNAMLPTLAIGGRLITYDGSPSYPDVKTFLRLIHNQGVNVFSTSPRFLAELQGAGIEPLELAPFDSLRAVVTGGAVMTPPVFEWAQKAFGPDVRIVSGMGGTDICAAFVSSVPALPIYAGELQAKSLGMAVEIYDENGNSIEDTGRPGELVCTRPHPSLPLGFWGDVNDEKFRKAYFNAYPGVWHQGDFIVKNPRTKGFMMLGRSDGVLNPKGIRFGSAEIYSVMESFRDEIDDSVCVGQRRPEDIDERVLLFVKMYPGRHFDEALVKRIRDAIRKALSARHVPSYIFQVDDIPYTVNHKKIEIAVKQIVSGSMLKPSGTVANPESLQLYYKYRDLEKAASAAEAGPRTKAKL